MTVQHPVQTDALPSIPRPQILEPAHDYADSFEVPANLDDSNVTRRRKELHRSKSLPRTFQGLSLG